MSKGMIAKSTCMTFEIHFNNLRNSKIDTNTM